MLKFVLAYKRLVVEAFVIVLAVGLGVMVYRHYHPTLTVTQIVPGEVQTVTVDRPVLTTNTVTKVLTDPKDKAIIKALMAENDKLKVDVTGFTQTVAKLEQTISGLMVPVPPPPDKPEIPIAYQFKDWHLTFRTDTKTATYTLSQSFEVLTSSGRNKAGVPVSLVKLFEIGSKGERIPMTDIKTVAVVADATSPHWLIGLNVQGGIGLTRDKAGVNENGGLVAVQWLKHGRTKATEDVTYAVLSPAFFFGPKVQDIGILPFSLNLGRIPHQPLTNLWVSPFVSKAQRLGFTITATF